jgi:hypothetical protein
VDISLRWLRERTPNGRKPWVLAGGVLALAAALLVILAGCGSSGKLPAQASPSATATSVKIRTITDTKYDFRMAYPFGWVGTRYRAPSPGGPEGTLQYVVAYADPKGAQAGGSYLDSEQIAVYQLARSMSPGDLDIETANRLIYDVILKNMSSLSPRTNLKAVKVAGVPGWQVGYEYQVGGEVVSARSALMVKGDRAYWLTAQAGTYTWRTVAPTLDACVRYFKLL